MSYLNPLETEKEAKALYMLGKLKAENMSCEELDWTYDLRYSFGDLTSFEMAQA